MAQLQEQTRLKVILVVANVLVALALAVVWALQSVDERTRLEATTYRHGENLAAALAQHSRQSLDALDLILLSIAEEIRNGGLDDPQALHGLLQRRQALTLGSYAINLYDATGRLVATSETVPIDRDTLPVLPEFAGLLGNPDADLILSPPRRNVIEGDGEVWLVPLGRRLTDSQGDFIGAVVAVMSVDYLLEYFNAIRLGDRGNVVLLSGDGSMIIRSPFVPGDVGRTFGDGQLFSEPAISEARGRMLTTSPLDGLRRYVAYERLNGTGAVVLVGIHEDDVLVPWRRQLVFNGVLSLMAIALLASGSVGAYSYFDRRRRWEAERTRRLRLIARESADLLACHDEDSVLARVTEAARELIGAHQAVTTLTRDNSLAQFVHSISLSDKYQQWRDFDLPPDGTGIYRLVCESNQPMRLTQAELEAHPAWRRFGSVAQQHPPLRGWLAVPIVAADGANLGLIQLSDKYQGEFTEDDQSELVQLASLTAAVLVALRAHNATEQALMAANAARQEVETIFTSISDAVYALDPQWRFVYLNARAEQLLNRRREELIGRLVWDEFPETRDTILYPEYHRARADNIAVTFEFYYPPLATWFAVRAHPHRAGLTVYFQDITARIDAEERLRQAQRMDAIGQLTGGIAHDFNNLLTVVLGTSESLLNSLEDCPAAVRRQLEIIQQASERGAALTHRLLAFARRQPLDPRATDINHLVGESEGMLHRVLGEDIQVELVRGTGLWRAVVDPNELQNAILNLAVNARDAMPGGGKLTIETANVAVDADYAALHEMTPGQYVMVAVTDTGMGIPAEILNRVFEPFFTTKEVGKGSGLGLSMVFGFARQSGGHVRVYSEPGEGTTFRLYLPRDKGGEIPGPVARRDREKYSGTESVLVVEDDPLVLQHTLNCLSTLGYRATGRGSGEEALSLLEGSNDFDLLLTDVVLPGGMSGRQVADAVMGKVPGIRVLFMSGYTENAIVHHGRLDPGVHLLAKPFRLADLGRKVREVLDSPGHLSS